MDISFFYSASVMGYGKGRFWHKWFNLPDYPRVTKTLTINKKKGYPFAVFISGNTVFNHVSLHNIGYNQWIEQYLSKFDPIWSSEKIIISLAGTDDELQKMVSDIDGKNYKFLGYELNFTCPNHCSFNNHKIPITNYPIYIKLNYLEDPYRYDLSKIEGIRVNSVPCVFGGVSGKYAQKYNWNFIKNFSKEVNISGCSCTSIDDICRLIDMGCKEIGLGAIVLTNPKFVEKLKEFKIY